MFEYWIIKRILTFLIVTVNLCLAQIERDIILTPKLSLHRNGKILYYKPKSNDISDSSNSTKTPWEQTLKHVTFLTLHNQIDEKSHNISNSPDYQNFLNSTYIQSNEHISKFGDIITLARGRLERLPNNQYFFVEGQCLKRCSENQSKSIAYWVVQKIRHRDPEKKFRYELKIDVIPNIGEKTSESNKRETVNKYESKAFILREDDYPENFASVEKHISQRRSDGNTDYLDQRISKFNDVFLQPQYLQNNAFSDEHQFIKKSHIPELNIGEYMPEDHAIAANSRVSVPPRKFLFPTTFHPKKYSSKYRDPNQIQTNYDVKFPEESSLVVKNLETPPPMAHHLHHHYYVTRNNFPELNTDNNYGSTFLKDNNPVLTTSGQQQPDLHHFHTSTPITNQIPIPPDLISHDHDLYKIPVTRPIIPPSPVIYMQPIPMYPLYPVQGQLDTKLPYNEPRKPFIESPEVQTVRYSDPDPLYHSDHYGINNFNYVPINIKEENFSEEKTSNRLNLVTETTADSEGSESGRNQNSNAIDIQLPPQNSINQHLVPTKSYHEISSQVATQSSATLATSAFLAPPKTSTEPSTTPTVEATIKEPSTENIKSKETEEEEDDDDDDDKRLIKITTATTTNQSPIVKRNYRPTTERPILRWKPKRTKWSKIPQRASAVTKETPIQNHHHIKPTNNNINAKYEFEKIPVNATEKVITVTPVTDDPNGNNDQEISTKQSVSTSISIKIGNETQERPFTPTISLPNIELFKANLENVKTNSSKIKLYKASSDVSGTSSKNERHEEHEIAKSIVQHFQSLTDKS